MAKKDMIRGAFINLIFSFIPFASERAKFIKKHNILYSCGENLFYQPRKLPTDPKCVIFHDNVVVAADVKFIGHDVIYLNMRNAGYKDVKQYVGCIEIMDNVFIGANSIILPDVRIGKNSIVAAGSLVNKDVPEDSIVGGVPAKVIGSASKLMKKRNSDFSKILYSDRYDSRRIEAEWLGFKEKRENI